MKIGVCNRFWATAGGGESYALAIAGALASMGQVELLCQSGVDWATVGERLQVDIDRFARREIDFDRRDDLLNATGDYDLFVNTSYATDLPSLATSSVLVVHFPIRPPVQANALHRSVSKLARNSRLVKPGTAVGWGRGFGPWEQQEGRFRWTDGNAVLDLWAPANQTLDVAIRFGADRPVGTTVQVVYEDTVLAETEVGPGIKGAGVAFKVTGRRDRAPTQVRLVCGTFRPAEFGAPSDNRELGVQVTDLRLGSELAHRLIGHSLLREESNGLRWLESYDRILVNSNFTRKWVRQWWGRKADVVYPGVPPQEKGVKDPVILSVGRFFPPERGHSKRQLEMVAAFRRLVNEGLRGWELHLVGGCQEADAWYLHQVQRAAEGLPVRIHVDMPGLLLSDLYARSSVYWQATGLFEDCRRDPERHEHFGIAVVEAMSAGAVPVVCAGAGPAETVRAGLDGYHFRSFDELVQATRRLVSDESLRLRLSNSAERRARNFRPEAMEKRLKAIVEAGGSGARGGRSRG